MHFLSTLCSSWAACFSLLQPSKLRQLLGAALLMTSDSYRALGAQSWWIIPLILGIIFLTKLPIVAFAILFFIIACSARSSVDAKNLRYFLNKFPLLLCYLLGLGVLFLIEQWSKPILLKLFWKWGILPAMTKTTMMIVLYGVFTQVSILLLIMLLFLIDTGMWARPIKNVPFNGIKMFCYNYPLFFLVFCIVAFAQVMSLGVIFLGIWMFDFLGIHFVKMDPLYLFVFLIVSVSLLFTPFCTALVHTFYVRRAYDQSQLYTYF